MINFIPCDLCSFRVESENGVHLGELLKEVDGFYVYYPESTQGCWSEAPLRLIADKLAFLNKEWSEIIDNDTNIGKAAPPIEI